VEVDAAPGASAAYSWNDRTIDFHHCRTCGCLTHYSSTPASDRDRLAVNARMMTLSELDGVKVRKFDGADTWRFIDEAESTLSGQ
jgi:hypothetical protein